MGTFHPVMTKLHGAAGRFQVGSYDLFHPPWGSTADTEFAGQDANSFVAGEFVWTGFDYLGEPNPYDSGRFRGYNHDDDVVRIETAIEQNDGFIPSRSSYFGIFDLAGFRKDRFYLYQSRWRPDLPVAHILPHWNWPERAGEITPVHVYTSGDEAELFLNGKSLGRKKRGQGDYRLRWDEVRYEPGELKVVTYRHGKKWAESVRRTTGPASGLALQSDRSELKADGKDLAFVTVDVVDKNGELVPRAMDRVDFTISGPGRIVAVDNGDPTRMESFQTTDIEAFNGKCLVIVQSAGIPGEVKLTARSTGLATAEVVVRMMTP
jgi:beta-galactosidase